MCLLTLFFKTNYPIAHGHCSERTQIVFSNEYLVFHYVDLSGFIQSYLTGKH